MGNIQIYIFFCFLIYLLMNKMKRKAWTIFDGIFFVLTSLHQLLFLLIIIILKIVFFFFILLQFFFSFSLEMFRERKCLRKFLINFSPFPNELSNNAAQQQIYFWEYFFFSLLFYSFKPFIFSFSSLSYSASILFCPLFFCFFVQRLTGINNGPKLSSMPINWGI